MYFIARTPQLRLSGLWSRSRLSSLPRRSYATPKLDLPALDTKWRQIWAEDQSLKTMQSEASIDHVASTEQLVESKKEKSEKDTDAGNHMYILPMFPYPSGNLHLGHLRVYTIADVLARFRRLQGREVLLPMGWDAFGLPAENAAIERGIDPAVWTKDNIGRMKEQMGLMNGSFDWSREFATCDPEFYKHTQYIFILLHRLGYASQKTATVNWDPVDNTVLANEQVDSEGRSWRSGAKVEQRELKQWFFHVTKFKEALLRDLEKLAEDSAWPERVLTQQRNWLGLTSGALYKFPVHKPNPEPAEVAWEVNGFTVYTTRPETVFAAQYIALAPGTELVEQLAKDDEKLRDFLTRTKDLPPDTTEGYLVPELEADSPLKNLNIVPDGQLKPIPVYVAPYVRGDYETGAIMGVPAHDARDFAFWKRHRPDEPLKHVVELEPSVFFDVNDHSKPYVHWGYMTSLAGSYAKLTSSDAARKIIEQVQEGTDLARPHRKWKIRDWLISRQRYWGTPIPIIHCNSCGAVPVPEKDLPVTLPKVDTHWANGRAGNPLESATDWVNVPCPSCSAPAKRDTDTMDTFVDSSWYYMRFPDPKNQDKLISSEAYNTYLPVDLYIGGVEHAILHLLYARFIYKAVSGILFPDGGKATDLEASSKEPFKRLITQGMVHGKTYTDPDTGRFLKSEEVDLEDPSKPKIVACGQTATVTFEKMSKSKHNGVDPTVTIAKYGADATRAHILFQAPVGEVLNWDEEKIAGVTRWLRRVYGYVHKVGSLKGPSMIKEESFTLSYFSTSQDRVEKMNKERSIRWNADIPVWRTTQNTIVNVTKALEDVYSLNTVVSHLMTMTNALIDKAPYASPIIQRKATEHLLTMMAPIAPAFAEECWDILSSSSSSPPRAKRIFGTEGSGASWPVPDGSLAQLGPKMRKCVVHVNGKMQGRVEIPMEPLGRMLASAGDVNPQDQKRLTVQILGNPDVHDKLKGIIDYQGTKLYFGRNGKVINYVVPKEW
ncbi:leucyl-tRNA synthetase [Whalleya microplaca]|nr:leucyl-tRNA synthetase [Whalleya microplaca]